MRFELVGRGLVKNCERTRCARRVKRRYLRIADSSSERRDEIYGIREGGMLMGATVEIECSQGRKEHSQYDGGQVLVAIA